MSMEVPPKKIANPWLTPNATANAGRMAISPKKTEPGNVIFVVTASIKSAVDFPGLIPGIKAF